MNVRWSHCVLKVRDLDAMIDFYCDALGFKLADRGELGPEQHIAFLSGSSSDHHQLGLMLHKVNFHLFDFDCIGRYGLLQYYHPYRKNNIFVNHP